MSAAKGSVMWFYLLLAGVALLLVGAAIVGNRRGQTSGPSHNPGAAHAEAVMRAADRGVGHMGP